MSKDDKAKTLTGALEDGSSAELLSESAERTTNDKVKPSQDAADPLWERLIRSGASVAVMAAATLGLLQYFVSVEDTKRERTLGLVNAWLSDGHSDRLAKIAFFIEAKRATTTLPPLDAPADFRAKALSNLGYAWADDIRSSELDRDVDRLVEYFSRIEICIDTDLCREDIVRPYLAQELTSFWSYFDGYARYRRENGYIRYGENVGALANRFAGPE